MHPNCLKAFLKHNFLASPTECPIPLSWVRPKNLHLKWLLGHAPDAGLRSTLSELSTLTKDGVRLKGGLYKVYFLPCLKLSYILSSLQVCFCVCEYGQEHDMYVSKSQRRTSLLTLFEMGLLFIATYTRLTSQGRPGHSLVSTSPVAIGTLGL